MNELNNFFEIIDNKFLKLLKIVKRAEKNLKTIKINVLSLDDDRAILKLYQTYFKKYSNINFYSAKNYKEFELLKKSLQIDVFMIDIIMPDKNGLEIIKNLRKNDNILICSSAIELNIEQIQQLKTKYCNLVWLKKMNVNSVLYDTIISSYLRTKKQREGIKV